MFFKSASVIIHSIDKFLFKGTRKQNMTFLENIISTFLEKMKKKIIAYFSTLKYFISCCKDRFLIICLEIVEMFILLSCCQTAQMAFWKIKVFINSKPYEMNILIIFFPIIASSKKEIYGLFQKLIF